MDEATQTGAAVSDAAPHSVDEAANKIAGLFGKTDKPEKPESKPEQSETNTEVEAEASAEVTQEEEGQDAQGEEKPESTESETRALTSLEDIEQALGIDRDALMQIRIKAKVDGEEQDATLEHILKNFQLDGHITRKSMEVSDLKKSLEKEKETFESDKTTKLGQLETAATIAHELLLGEYKSIDWAKLEKEDPIEYLTQKDKYTKYNASLNQIHSVIQQDKQKVLDSQTLKLKEFVQEQQKLLASKLPNWADEKVRAKEYGELVGFLKTEFNVTPEELNTILDHRFYELAYDAKRYRELMKKNPIKDNKDRTPPKFVKPGSPQGQAQRGAVQISDLKKNFSKNRDEKSAGALINALIKPKR